MPDGDRFESRLRGKGWRKAYRQACDGAPFDMLSDTLMGAAAAALRGPLACNTLAKVRDAVCQALKEKARTGELDFGDRSLADPYRMLSDLLSDIVRDDNTSIQTQLAAKAGRSIYIEFEHVCDFVTTKDIQERLAEAFGENIIRNQWLARVRKGIALANNSTTDEQMVREEDLFKRLSEPLRKMINPLFQTDRDVTVRAPRRTTPQRKMTIEELHKGIAVLEV